MDNLGQPQDPERKIVGYRFFPAVTTPVVLSLIVIILGVLTSWWLLAAIPFIYLGSVCATPSPNLIEGLPVFVFMLVGVVVLFFHLGLGILIIVGTPLCWMGSGFEKAQKAKPIYEGDSLS